MFSFSESRSAVSTVCDPMEYTVHGILQARIWSGELFPSPGFFPTQGSNPGLLHCGRILYHLSHQGHPIRATDVERVCGITYTKQQRLLHITYTKQHPDRGENNPTCELSSIFRHLKVKFCFIPLAKQDPVFHF